MPKYKNDIKIGNHSPLEDDLSTLNVGEKRSSLEIATVDNGARVRGDLEVTGIVKELKTKRISSDANITLDPDGDLIISGADIKITATKKLYLDGGTDTYLHEVSADQLDIVVGGNTISPPTVNLTVSAPDSTI